MSDSTTVLVVDDESDIADLYTTWLEPDYDVRTTYGGEDAIQSVDESVDIVFLDRQMPGQSGDDVLEAIREGDLDVRVVMVTAVDPDFDIVSMDFDDYLTKPVMREDLVAAVTTMLERDEYDEQLQEYYALAAKKAALEVEKTANQLESNDQYQRMVERVERLECDADETAARLDAEYESLFQEFPDGE